jgi:hypothetical protein
MLRLVALSLCALLAAACSSVGARSPEPTPGIIPLGQKVEYEQIGLTINSAERRDSIGESSTPGAGTRYLVVDVSLTNSTTHKISYNRYQFKVQDDAGRAYEPVAVPGQERPLLASELEPQKDAAGTIVFKVPATVGPLLLIYQPPGVRTQLRVDLGA